MHKFHVPEINVGERSDTVKVDFTDMLLKSNSGVCLFLCLRFQIRQGVFLFTLS